MQGWGHYQHNLFHHREILRSRGFRFCDDDPVASQRRRPEEDRESQQLVGHTPNIVLRACRASTTDADTQAIQNTVHNTHSFWSSRGSRSANAEDWLLYQLCCPNAVVRAVTIAPYRARFQFGEPTYPPEAIQLDVGPSIARMLPATRQMAVRAGHVEQTFLVPEGAPVGGFLRIRLLGKPQEQLEDHMHYLAMRYVAVQGTPSSPALLMQVREMLADCCCLLPGSLSSRQIHNHLRSCPPAALALQGHERLPLEAVPQPQQLPEAVLRSTGAPRPCGPSLRPGQPRSARRQLRSHYLLSAPGLGPFRASRCSEPKLGSCGAAADLDPADFRMWVGLTHGGDVIGTARLFTQQLVHEGIEV